MSAAPRYAAAPGQDGRPYRPARSGLDGQALEFLFVVWRAPRIAPVEQPLLDLEDRVQYVLDVVAVAVDLEAGRRKLGQRVAHLEPHLARDRLDPITVELLEAPQNLVRGVEHAVEGIAALIVPPNLLFQLFDC